MAEVKKVSSKKTGEVENAIGRYEEYKRHYDYAKSAFLATVIAIVLLGFSIFSAVKLQSDVTQINDLQRQVSSLQASAEQTNIRENGVSYRGVNGQTALAILKQNYKVTTKTYSGMGEFVTAINGVSPSDSQYWAFYVNGKLAEVGAGSYTTKTGDKIEWKLAE